MIEKDFAVGDRPYSRVVLEYQLNCWNCLEAGVEFLDEHFPEWFKTIKKHLDDFSISSAHDCVLGTIARHDMNRFRGFLDEMMAEGEGEEDEEGRPLKMGADPYEAALRVFHDKLGQDDAGEGPWAEEHGFTIDSPNLEFRAIPYQLQWSLLQEAWMAYFTFRADKEARATRGF